MNDSRTSTSVYNDICNDAKNGRGYLKEDLVEVIVTKFLGLGSRNDYNKDYNAA